MGWNPRRTLQVHPPVTVIGLIHRAPGLQASYYGFSPSHPNLATVWNIWSSIHIHHGFQHSAEYPDFINLVRPYLAGKLEPAHFDVPDETKSELKTAIESPVTQVAKLPIAIDKAHEHLTWFKDSAPDYLAPISDKRIALWTGHPYEDVYFPLPWDPPFEPGVDCRFTFYHILGWNSLDDHPSKQKAAEYAEYINKLKEHFEPGKDVDVYYFELKKAYGDW